MTDELQPELFKLAPPPPARPVCSACGSTAAVIRYGIVVCTVCGNGREQAATADRNASTKALQRRRARRGR